MSLYLVRSGNFITGLFHVPHAWFSFILPDSGMPSWFNARKGKASGFIACRAPAPSVDLILFPKLHLMHFEIKMAASSKRSISRFLWINGKLLIVQCGRILRIQLTLLAPPCLGRFAVGEV